MSLELMKVYDIQLVNTEHNTDVMICTEVAASTLNRDSHLMPVVASCTVEKQNKDT